MIRFLPRILALAALATALLGLSTPAFAAPTIVPINQGDCQGFAGTHFNDTNNTTIVNAPSGSIIQAIAIKDGNASPFLGSQECVVFTQTDTFFSPNAGTPCYVVTFAADRKSATIQEFPQQGCGDVSHFQVNYSTAPPNNTPPNNTPPNIAPPDATPELDSFVLFGVGGLALAGYALHKRRSAPKS